MLRTILESGCLNVTFWSLLCLALVAILRPASLYDRKIGRLLVFCIVFCTLGNFSLALYRGYAVPRDILQDIIAADEYLAGRPMHPDDMGPMMGSALAREGERPSLLERWPSLRQKEREQMQEAIQSHWVQAHPPFMTLFTALFLRQFGILGTQIAFLIMSLAAMATMLWLFRRELSNRLTVRISLALGFLVLGWDPVLTLLRAGQIGLVMCGLLTLSWCLLRHEYRSVAGVLIGVAVSLKLIPAVVLVVLLMRHRRAFLAATVTILGIGLSVLAGTSIADHLDYFRISRGVVDEYASYRTNISFLGFLARGARLFGIEYGVAKAVWMGSGIAIALVTAWLFRRKPATAQARQKAIDLEFALAMTVMPLLSPVAWDHYLTFLLLPFAVLGRRLLCDPSRSGLISYTLLLVLFAVPDTTYIWVDGMLRAANMTAWSVVLVLPFRTYLVLWLGCWLIRRIRSEESNACLLSGSPAVFAARVEIPESAAVPRVLHGVDARTSAP